MEERKGTVVPALVTTDHARENVFPDTYHHRETTAGRAAGSLQSVTRVLGNTDCRTVSPKWLLRAAVTTGYVPGYEQMA